MSASNDNTSAPQMTDVIPITNSHLFNVNMTNVTKLTDTNFLMWKLQVRSLVAGYGLIGHLDGSMAKPPLMVTTNGVDAPNPAFSLWQRQDQLLYSALLGSVSLGVQTTLSQTTTAAEIWTTLAEIYAKPSRGHVRQLKNQLKVATKGNNTIDEYVCSLTTKFDTLALLEAPVLHDDKIEQILDGLPEEYRPIVDQVASRDVSPSIAYVHERLLNHEAKLLAKAASPTLPITANVATQRNNHSPRFNNTARNNNKVSNNNTSSSTWQPNHNNTHRRNFRPYLGKCQFCNVQGHSAKRCPQLQNCNNGYISSSTSPFTPWQHHTDMTTS
ncbi:PREDICTED: uncharacterized protein LOC104772670 [Camelina sativa]|uniref:Uncharacterized protein LOC104772670 n=1 Tax=Camelina sativa TaxID=90675 RepID=A0ABM0Y4X6_CAMSA|nr:PREDICTED: uncharacterized protein LOC104772670 [Camelina sativa]